MSEEDRVQFKFMIPSALKAKLEEAAHETRRSLSAEIVARLEQSIEEKPTLVTGDITSRLEQVYKEMQHELALIRLERKSRGIIDLNRDPSDPHYE